MARTLAKISSQRREPVVSVSPVQPPMLSSKFGNAPPSLVKRHAEWIGNNPNTQAAIGLIRGVVKDVRLADQVRDEINNVNPVGRSLTPRNVDSLERAGVIKQDQRSNASCLSDNRPQPKKTGGSGRPFVPWCAKDGGKK